MKNSTDNANFTGAVVQTNSTNSTTRIEAPTVIAPEIVSTAFPTKSGPPTSFPTKSSPPTSFPTINPTNHPTIFVDTDRQVMKHAAYIRNSFSLEVFMIVYPLSQAGVGDLTVTAVGFAVAAAIIFYLLWPFVIISVRI